MAQLPTIASTANRRLLPTADLRIEGGSPAAFGAAAGTGLEQIGQAGQNAGAALQQFQQAKQQELDRLAEFDRQTQFVNFGSDQSTKLEEAARGVSGPAVDFTKSRMEQFDTDAEQFMSQVPERFKKQWGARMAQLRSGVASSALRTEFSQRDSYYKTTTGDALGKLLNGAMSTPDQLDAWKAQGEEIINTSGLSPQDKLEYLTRWKGQVGVAAAQGDLQRDPVGALTRLGGISTEVVEVTTGGASGTQPTGNFAKMVGITLNSESGGKRYAPGGGLLTSSAGAKGEMQVLDSTNLNPGFGVAPAKNNSPEERARVGREYLAAMLKRYGGDAAKAWAAYNGGPGRVDDAVNAKGSSWLSAMPGETQAYVAKNMQALGKQTVTQSPTSVMGYAVDQKPNTAAWGKREDGTAKGLGWLGPLKRPDGGVSTEISVGVEINGKETEIPLMVPGLTKTELDYLMTHDPQSKDFDKGLPPGVMQKAIEHAQSRIAEGKSPFRGKGETLPSDGGVTTFETRNVGTGAVDPRYADIPVDARIQLIGAAEREIAQREHKEQVAQQQAHSTWLNQFMNDLNDGKAGAADIEAARKSGRLTDFDEINRAQSIVEARQRATADINTYNTLVGTPGFAWNPYDDRQRKAVDAAVAAQGGTPQAAFDVWQRTGILGKAGGVALRGAMISTDANQVSAGASIASNMLARNPNAFAGVEGGEEIERNALLYGHYVNDLGYSPQDAAARVAQQNSPEMRSKIKMGQPEVTDFRKQVQKTNVQSVLGRALDTTWFDGTPTFAGPEQKQAAAQDYADLAADHFQRYGDASAAQAFALAQMKRLYGVVNGRLMKYPPTKAYPSIGGSQDYIFQQAAADIKSVTGRAIDPKNVYLLPIPTATAEAYRAGKAPPYEVHYIDQVNGQNVYRVLNGQAFYADTQAAARAEGTKRKAQLQREREDYLAREQMGRDATVARFGILPGVTAPARK